MNRVLKRASLLLFFFEKALEMRFTSVERVSGRSSNSSGVRAEGQMDSGRELGSWSLHNHKFVSEAHGGRHLVSLIVGKSLNSYLEPNQESTGEGQIVL